MSRRVSKRLTSLQSTPKPKGHDTGTEPRIDRSPKRIRPDNATKSLKNDQSIATATATVITATDDSSCSQQDFEADIAKAMKLSLMSAEKLYETTTQDITSLLDQQCRPQHECPVCNAPLEVSIDDFERHVNQCLDQSTNKLCMPNNANTLTTTTTTTTATATTTTTTTSEQQNVSSWGQIFQSIPNVLHKSWISKIVSTANSSPPIVSTPVTTAPISSTSNQHMNYMRRTRQVPTYKWMKDTRFIVDAFNYGKIPNCDGYFLTHFHSDHYGGLNHAWSAGPIYCSQVTANLVVKQLEVDELYLRVLPMNEPTYVHPHVKVTLIDANHCPGSVLFIFDIQCPAKGDNGDNKLTWIRHLHTGDFRANPKMCLHPLLRQPDNPTIDNLYLDTTYLNAKYGFPAQEECIQAACRVIEVYLGLKDDNRPKTMLEQWMGKTKTTETTTTTTSSSSLSESNTCLSAFDTIMSNAKRVQKSQGLLVVVGTYSIGKEKVFCAIAKLLKSKIYVTEQKRFILRCQEDPEMENILTRDPLEAQVHILPLNQIKAETMHAYMKKLSPRFTNMIAFRPTGWTYRPSKAQETEMSIGSLSQVTVAPADRTLYLQPSHSSPTLKIYGVPYSEHSSFRELASFIASLDINHVVPTVYSESEKGRQRMFKYLEKWQQDKQGKPIKIVPYPADTHW